MAFRTIVCLFVTHNLSWASYAAPCMLLSQDDGNDAPFPEVQHFPATFPRSLHAKHEIHGTTGLSHWRQHSPIANQPFYQPSKPARKPKTMREKRPEEPTQPSIFTLRRQIKDSVKSSQPFSSLPQGKSDNGLEIRPSEQPIASLGPPTDTQSPPATQQPLSPLEMASFASRSAPPSELGHDTTPTPATDSTTSTESENKAGILGARAGLQRVLQDLVGADHEYLKLLDKADRSQNASSEALALSGKAKAEYEETVRLATVAKDRSELASRELHEMETRLETAKAHLQASRLDTDRITKSAQESVSEAEKAKAKLGLMREAVLEAQGTWEGNLKSIPSKAEPELEPTSKSGQLLEESAERLKSYRLHLMSSK